MSDIFTPSISDVTRAQKAATAILQEVASDSDVYAASMAMLAAPGKHEGYAAYHASLYASADADAQTAARDAFATALGESKARFDAAHVTPDFSEFDADDSDDSEDDSLV